MGAGQHAARSTPALSDQLVRNARPDRGIVKVRERHQPTAAPQPLHRFDRRGLRRAGLRSGRTAATSFDRRDSHGCARRCRARRSAEAPRLIATSDELLDNALRWPNRPSEPPMVARTASCQLVFDPEDQPLRPQLRPKALEIPRQRAQATCGKSCRAASIERRSKLPAQTR